MKRLGLLAVLAFSLVLVSRSDAQNAPATPAKCDPAGLITQLAALKSAGDQDKDLAALNTVVDQISAQRIACKGFTFSGVGNKVVDPFDLPAGAYRAKIVSTGKDKPFVLSANTKDTKNNVFGCIAIITEDGETSLSPENPCRVLLSVNVSPATTAWTVTLEPIQ